VAQLYPQAPITHFSRLLRHAWATVGLFFSPVTTGGEYIDISLKIFTIVRFQRKQVVPTTVSVNNLKVTTLIQGHLAATHPAP